MLQRLMPLVLLSVLLGPAYADDPTTTDPEKVAAPDTPRPMIKNIAVAGERIFFTDSTGKQWCYQRTPWTLLWTKAGGKLVRFKDAPTPAANITWGLETPVAIQALRRGVDPSVIARLTDGAHPTAAEIEASKKPEVKPEVKPVVKPEVRPPAFWDKRPGKFARAANITWQEKYLQGARVAKRGATLGRAGLISGGVGIGFVFVGVLQSSGYNFFEGPVQNVGYGFMAVGGLSAIVGGNMAAAGTMRSHRALADAGLRKRRCGLCNAAWATAIPIPTPAYLVTLPLSYGISGAKRQIDRAVYDKAVKPPMSTLQVSPNLGPTGAGIRISGTL